MEDYIYLHRAEALIEIARWREAIHELHQYLRLSPEGYRGVCSLAQCYYNLKEYEPALKWARRAAEINPLDEWAHRLQAIVLRKQNRSKEAFAAAREAARLAPQEPFALHILACCELDVGQLDHAQQNAERMREIAPEEKLAYSMLGQVAMKRQQWQQAETNFRQALELDPNSYEAMNNVGWCLLKQAQSGIHFDYKKRRRQREQAKDFFARTIKIDPTNDLAKTNLKAAERAKSVWQSGRYGWSIVLIIIGLARIGVYLPLLIALLLRTFTPFHPNSLIYAVNIYFLIVFPVIAAFWFTLRSKSETTFQTRERWRKIPLKQRKFIIAAIFAAPTLTLVPSWIQQGSSEFFHSFTPLAWVSFSFFFVGALYYTAAFFEKEKAVD